VEVTKMVYTKEQLALYQAQLVKCHKCRFAQIGVNPCNGEKDEGMKYCIHPEHDHEWIWQSVSHWHSLTFECFEFKERT